MKYRQLLAGTVLCLILICAFPLQAFAMDIFVKIPGSSAITLEVENGDLVSAVKLIIFDKTGIPCEQQILVFADNTLLDENTLEDYNIQREATIHLTVQPVLGFADNKIEAKYVTQSCVLVLAVYHEGRLLDVKLLSIDKGAAAVFFDNISQDISATGLLTAGATRITAMLLNNLASATPLCISANS